MAVASGGLVAVTTLSTGSLAHAAGNTYTVTNLNDTGTGSLRAAIASVNADTSDTAAPGDSIVFNSGLSGSLNLTSTDKTNDSLYVGRPVQITGPGANVLAIHSDPNNRILEFGEYGGVTSMAAKVSGLTLTGGSITGGDEGGAITSSGELELDSDVFANNNSAAKAGAVQVGDATLTVNDSTFSGNTATDGGGALYGYGPVIVNRSTFVGNSAYYGGAIDTWEPAGYVSISDSTVSGNTSSRGAGGIYSFRAATVKNSTITGNTGETGAGLSTKYGATIVGSTVAGNTISSGGSGGQIFFKDADPLVLQDSIVSGSGSVPDLVLPSGTSASASFSLIRNASAPSGDATVSTDATDITGFDPQLAPLALNGGPTETMVPLPTSPVLDRGNSEGLTTDQRGLARPFVLPTVPASVIPAGGDHADIGAVETETPALAAISPSSGSNGTHVTIAGVGFTGATKVLFGNVPAGSFMVVNDTEITAVAPLNAQTQDVRVITPLGESPVVAADQFTFPTFTPTVSKPRAKLSGSKVNTGIKVSCPASGLSCTGSFKATAFIKHHKTRLAKGSISLSAGHGKTLTFKLGSKAMKQLKSAGKLKITIHIVIADGSEKPITVNRTITLKYKHKKH